MADFMLTRRRLGQVALGTASAAALAGGLGGVAHAKKYKYGTAAAAGSISARFATRLFELVKERTGGEVDFDVFANTLGLGELQLLQGAALGTVDGAGTAATATREFDVFYAPYFFRDREHAGRVGNGLLKERTSKVLETKYQIKLLGVGRAGPWNLFLRRPVQSFDELRGMKIRAAQIEGQIEGLKHLGAEAVSIAFNELYGALQQGIVDGASTLANLGIAQKFYEVAKYQVTNDFGFGLDKYMISLRTWNGLTKAQQEVMEKTFAELEPELYYKVDLAEAPQNLKRWEELNGRGTVITLDATAAQRKMEPLNKKLADDIFGAGTWDQIVKA
jgi:TRAP-type C4-dicarboxylate transport system substrate-binding protein